MTINEIVTQTILDKMEQAQQNNITYYWIKPFSANSPHQAYSYDTGIPYHGINRLLLDADEYLTYKKMKEIGKQHNEQYHIRKGAKSNIVIYFNTIPVVDEETGEQKTDPYTGKPMTKGFIQYYRVFSRQDVVDANGDNLPSKFHFEHYSHDEMTDRMQKALDLFHRLINLYCKKYNIQVEVTKDGTEAYYNPISNIIRFPHIENFESIYEYMHTIAHETIHSTMLPLGRLTHKDETELEQIKLSYSKEELVAEIGAEMLLQNLCIPDDREYKENSIAYIQGWSKYLKDKPYEIVSASAKAETACDFILNMAKELEHEQVKTINEEEPER